MIELNNKSLLFILLVLFNALSSFSQDKIKTLHQDEHSLIFIEFSGANTELDSLNKNDLDTILRHIIIAEKELKNKKFAIVMQPWGCKAELEVELFLKRCNSIIQYLETKKKGISSLFIIKTRYNLLHRKNNWDCFDLINIQGLLLD